MLCHPLIVVLSISSQSHSGGIVNTSILIVLCDCCFGHSKIPEGCLDVNHNPTVKDAEMKGAWEPTSFTLKE